MSKQIFLFALLLPLLLASCIGEIKVETKTSSEILSGLNESTTQGLYNIDGLKKNALVQLFEPYVIEDDITIVHGWAVDPIKQSTADEVWAKIDTFMFRIYDIDASRPDVAAHFSQPDYENVGFSGAIYTKDLEINKGELSIIIINRDENLYFPAAQTKVVHFKNN